MTDYKDPGLNAVAEFHRLFNCHIATSPAVPTVTDETHVTLQTYALAAHRMAVHLKEDAADANRNGDKAGALLLIRLQLIQEELAELADAFAGTDTVGALDALTDITYVVDGTYLSVGLAPYKVAATAEVHDSNMSKLGDDGLPIISDAGRVVKGPHYRKPDLRRVLGRALG